MYQLNFTIHGNPDRDQGDWEENHALSAANIDELRKAVFAFQCENNIGGGNWGEAVVTREGTLVGYMSYNGRVWNKPYWGEESKEVVDPPKNWFLLGTESPLRKK